METLKRGRLKNMDSSMKMALFHLLLQTKLLLPPKYFVVYAAQVKVRIQSVLSVDARRDESLVAYIEGLCWNTSATDGLQYD